MIPFCGKSSLISHCIHRVPTPFYFNHLMCLDMLGVRLQPLDCQYEAKEEGFIPSVDEARTLINESTRAILLVSPNNRKLLRSILAPTSATLSNAFVCSNWNHLLCGCTRCFLRAMQRGKDCIDCGRDIPRLCTTKARAITQSLLQARLGVHPHKSVLVLEIIRYSRPPSWCNHSIKRVVGRRSL